MEDISRDAIRGASKGDMQSFEEIYRKTSGFVYSVALRVTCNETDADEVTQDVFMKIYKNVGKFHFLSSFKTWVYRITVNAAINHQKAAEKHLSRRADYDSAIQAARTDETARDDIDKQGVKERVSVLLGALNPEQRACMVLREIEGLDYKEIAGALRININTVRSRLKRARERLLSITEKR